VTWQSSRLSVWLLLLAAFPVAAEPLPALGADTRQFTVSGLSSGGYMAVQLHVAHSSRVTGMAAIAAGPYYCAQGSLFTAYYNCMTPGAWTPLPAAPALRRQVELLGASGRVDAPANLASAKVWLFSGRDDRTVRPEVVEGLKAFYESFRAAPLLIADKAAGHGMVTDDRGSACAVTAPPYLNDCDYDAAGALLAHLLGALKPRAAAAGRLVEFEQKGFDGAGLADNGYLYVPQACEGGGCRLHVAFHGCRQTAEEFAEGAGYNRWAEGNRLVVLYPQVRASFWPYNPRGCWDWWGYTGPEYHTREGAQVKAVMAMVARLSEERKSPTRSLR
jgi:poly(3-hydroxybutyrate) depolymerase